MTELAMSFEEGLQKLDLLSKELERDDLPLEKATELYQEAKELGNQLHAKLEEAQLKLQGLDGEKIDAHLEEA